MLLEGGASTAPRRVQGLNVAFILEVLHSFGYNIVRLGSGGGEIGHRPVGGGTVLLHGLIHPKN